MDSLDHIVAADSSARVLMIEAARLIRVRHAHHVRGHTHLLVLLTLHAVVHRVARVHLHFLLMQNVVHFVTAHPCLLLHVGPSTLEILDYLDWRYWQ